LLKQDYSGFDAPRNTCVHGQTNAPPREPWQERQAPDAIRARPHGAISFNVTVLFRTLASATDQGSGSG
jgi:hypothetical protein